MFSRVELGLDRPDDAAGDLVLEREKVRQFDVVTFRPNLPTSRRVGQLRADAKALARTPDASIQHVTHAEGAPDFSHVEQACREK